MSKSWFASPLIALSLLCLSSAGLAQAPLPRAAGAAAPSPDARLREVDRDPKLFEQYYKVGKRVAAFCANCHGEGGNSVKSDVPNLAGQNTAYLLEQVRQFSDGRRKNLFMEGLMKALSHDEKVGIAVYYSNQEVVHRPAPPGTRRWLPAARSTTTRSACVAMARWAMAAKPMPASVASRTTT